MILLLISLRISVLVGPSVKCKVRFIYFRTSYAVSQSFRIREDIHISPVVLAPRDWKRRFWISVQSYDISPIRAWSEPIFDWFIMDIDIGEGKDRGGGLYLEPGGYAMHHS